MKINSLPACQYSRGCAAGYSGEVDGVWWSQKVGTKPLAGVCQSRFCGAGGFFFPCLTRVGNGASDPLARCQGRATKTLGSGWGLFVEVCRCARVNFLSIIVSHNVYKTSTLI